MEGFTEQKLDHPLSIGEECKRKREEKKLSLREVSRAISIQLKYLEAIEKDHYDILPARVYTVNFLKAYARFLGLHEEKVAKRFIVQAETRDLLERRHARNTELIRPRVMVTPTTIKRFIVGGAGISVLAYLSFQLSGMLMPPVIRLSIPSSSFVETTEGAMVLKGTIERGSALTVNGKSVYINETGAFEKEVLLSDGINTFELVAANRFNRKTVMQFKIKRFSSFHE